MVRLVVRASWIWAINQSCENAENDTGSYYLRSYSAIDTPVVVPIHTTELCNFLNNGFWCHFRRFRLTEVIWGYAG